MCHKVFLLEKMQSSVALEGVRERAIEMFQTVLTRFTNALNIPAMQKNMPKGQNNILFWCSLVM